MSTNTHSATSSSTSEITHVLPAWFEWLQRNVFLTFLILANMYILGTLATTGWVDDLEKPQDWGVYHAVGVVLLFCVGALMAGISLRVSIKAAAALQERRYTLGLFNLIGAVVFGSIEVWASLSERSTHLRPTPADVSVLALIDVRGIPVSPTVVAVALMLPLCTLYWGFSQQRPVIKTAEEIEEETDRAEARLRAQARLKRAQAEENAKIRATQVRGMAVTAAAAKDGAIDLFGRQQAAEPSADRSTGDHGDDDPNGGGGLPHDHVAASHDATHSSAQSFPGLVRMGKAPVSQPNRAAYNRMPLHRRVAETGVITTHDLVDALNISDSQARQYLLDIPTTVRMGDHKTAKIETPVGDVLAYFQSKGTHAGSAHYQALRDKLNPRRGGKPRHAASTHGIQGSRAALTVVHPQPAAQMAAQMAQQMAAQSSTKQSQRYSAGEYEAGYAGGYAVEPRVAVEVGGQ